MQPLTKATTRALRPGSGFICRGCRQLRPFSHSSARSLPSGSSSSKASACLTQLTSRRLLSISGPDAAKFLQGAITANVPTTIDSSQARTVDSGGFYGAFLTAQGRVLYDVFVYHDVAGVGRSAGGDPNSSFLIEVDAAEAERLQRHIKRYKLRAKFETRLLDGEELGVWHGWHEMGNGEKVNSEMAAGSKDGLDGPLARGIIEQGGIALKDKRVLGLGVRILALRANDLVGSAELEQVPEERYRIHRYLNGVAEGQEELLREQALPHESNMDVTGAIDFHKGCYVGQELTIRTQHRGVVRKRLLPCVLYSEDQGMPDELLYRPSIGAGGDGVGEPGGLTAEMVPTETNIERAGKKSRRVGKWIKGVGNVGLALCRLEIMTDLALPGETAASTYTPDDEFVMHMGLGEDGESFSQVVKVKAFVPWWLRKGLEKPDH